MSDISPPRSGSIEDIGQPWHRLVSRDQWRVWFGSTLVITNENYGAHFLL